ncbi:MAG: glucose-6-phosphate isomerase [Bacillota bacterium]|nr:MAG: glucose-6-phosphate isomerase [Bacillota bacterium]MBS3950719.1 hypothetical protein [Peptococcaceae bacterium]
MLELERLAFLDVNLASGRVQFGSGLPQVNPACRYLREARYAFSDEGVEGLEELYYMYRDVARCEDRPIIAQHGLRFDITLIPAGLIGQEYNKTVGHYHPVKLGTVYTYPEVYEVLHGEATYLLQRPSVSRGEVDDVAVVVARAGDKVVIPPGYGHITINAGVEPLLMANWVASEFDSIYGEIKELKGGAHYLVGSGREPEWINNHRYIKAPDIRRVETRDYPELGLFSGQPMYKLIIEAPEKLRFLTHPEEYQWVKLCHLHN